MNYEQLRFEAAKAAMQGILASGTQYDNRNERISDAIDYADALLAALGISPEDITKTMD